MYKPLTERTSNMVLYQCHPYDHDNWLKITCDLYIDVYFGIVEEHKHTMTREP